MKGVATKFLGILCILQVAKCIDAQKQRKELKDERPTIEIGNKEAAIAGENYDEQPTVSTQSSIDLAETVITAEHRNDIKSEKTTTVVELVTEGTEKTVSPDGTLNKVGDDVDGRDKYCRCDCDTGIILSSLPNESGIRDEVDESTEKPVGIQEIQGATVGVLETDADEITQGKPKLSAASSGNFNEGITDGPVTSQELPRNTESVTEADTVPLTPCSEVGDFPNEVDCHAYFTCSPSAEGLQRTDRQCAPKAAFNVQVGRCTRDISACDDGVVCSLAGTFEDINSNASYYWCVARLLGGFRKYHIDCAAGKVFVPALGKCFLDINNLHNLLLLHNGADNDDQPDDEDIVEAELKQFKAEEKLKLKEQKLKLKLEKKLQKELAKKAAKEAKEEARAKKSLQDDD